MSEQVKLDNTVSIQNPLPSLPALLDRSSSTCFGWLASSNDRKSLESYGDARTAGKNFAAFTPFSEVKYLWPQSTRFQRIRALPSAGARGRLPRGPGEGACSERPWLPDPGRGLEDSVLLVSLLGRPGPRET